MNRKEIKAKAKEFAFNNKWNILKPFVIYIGLALAFGVILGLLGVFAKLDPDGAIIEGLTNIFSIATMPITYAATRYVMHLMHGKKLTMKEALFGRYHDFLRILMVTLVVGLLTFIGMLLLIVPGIIFAYHMAMTGYILCDDEYDKLKHSEVTNLSKKLMNGHKWDFFVFEMSFFGWILLSVFTLGIALIWVLPYMEVANIMYYEELKKLVK